MEQIRECYEAFTTLNFSENHTPAICSAAAYVTCVFALGCNCPKTGTQINKAEVNGIDMLQETG